MKLKQIAAVLPFLFIPLFAKSAELSAGMDVEFLAINGQKIERFGKEAKKQLELVPGPYQLIAQFEKSLKQGSKNMLFTSKPYIIELTIDRADLELSIPLLRNAPQATAFFRSPKWQLTDMDTKEMRVIPAKELIGAGFAAYSDIEKALTAHNELQAPVKSVSTLASTIPVVPMPRAQEKNDSDNLAKLKLWYSKATNAEKKAFKYWMLDMDE